MIYLFRGPTSRAKTRSWINPSTLLAYTDLIIE
jgi:hypothetical protein